jgi:hypothetical protein
MVHGGRVKVGKFNLSHTVVSSSSGLSNLLDFLTNFVSCFLVVRADSALHRCFGGHDIVGAAGSNITDGESKVFFAVYAS